MMTTVLIVSKVLDKKRKVMSNGFIYYLRFSRNSEYTKIIFHISKLVRIIFIHVLAWF